MALSIKIVFVVLGTMGMASMWEAVFADMGVALAAIVNSTRVLRGRLGPASHYFRIGGGRVSHSGQKTQ
jgi:cation transport ATPase